MPANAAPAKMAAMLTPDRIGWLCLALAALGVAGSAAAALLPAPTASGSTPLPLPALLSPAAALLGLVGGALGLATARRPSTQPADPGTDLPKAALAGLQGIVRELGALLQEERGKIATLQEICTAGMRDARTISTRVENLTEAALDAYNAYPIDYPEGGRQDHYPLASALLHDYKFFLSQPWLTSVHWAQFMDTGGGNWSGMVSLDGHRKAVFNAYAIYARMPVDRRQMFVNGPDGLEGMASLDTHRASLVFWNRTGQEQTAHVALHHLPLTRGHLRVFRIDAAHASWGDDPANERLLPTETQPLHDSAPLTWSGTIPDGGVVYLEADDDSDRSDLDANPVAKVIRTLHFYPDRSQAAYADFDRNTWIARLGMGSEASANATVGVTAEGLPPRLRVFAQTDGAPARHDAGSLLGVRIDYQVGDAYTKSVLFHGPLRGGPDLYDARRPAPMPWGTQRPPDETVRVADFAHFPITPRAHAPAHWTGRAQITFLMQNTGAGTRAKIVLRR